MRVLSGLFCFCLGIFAPVVTAADTTTDPPANAMPTVIITEIQTRNATVAQEFIELYNTTSQPVDLSGWAVWYLPAANGPDKLAAGNVLPLRATGNSTSIPAHGYYVLSDGGDYAAADQTYAASQGLLADSGGNLWLVSPAPGMPCGFTPQDTVGWGSAAHSAGDPAKAPAAGQSIERLIAGGQYVDTGNNATDFGVSTQTLPPTPGAQNNIAGIAGGYKVVQSSDPVIDPTCMPPPTSTGSTGAQDTNDNGTNGGDGLAPASPAEPPATIEPAITSGQPSSVSSQTPTPPLLPEGDVGLAPPDLTELLPNPAPPQTDATDEFIELYNPNDAGFDLSGFELEIGTAVKHHFVFAAGTLLAGHGFGAYFSADTNLSLSNSGGQVSLLDPLGNVIGQTAAYGTAKDGQAWALANGAWFWTTTPTPDSPNVITSPVPAKTAKDTQGKPAAVHKTASAKTAKSGTSSSGSPAATTAGAQLDASVQAVPVHSYVLAIAVAFALLYGAYEYRRDVANKLYQFRCYRSARRKNRADAKGG